MSKSRKKSGFNRGRIIPAPKGKPAKTTILPAGLAIGYNPSYTAKNHSGDLLVTTGHHFARKVQS